jgi:hypothetical protein
MLTIGKKMLVLFVLVCAAAAPLACLSINKPPEDQHSRTEVNVGGERAVTVDHRDSK